VWMRLAFGEWSWLASEREVPPAESRRPERLDRDQMQLSLVDIVRALANRDAEEKEQQQNSAPDKAADQRKQRRINRGALPAHLRAAFRKWRDGATSHHCICLRGKAAQVADVGSDPTGAVLLFFFAVSWV
jgi:hypothetical protein